VNILSLLEQIERGEIVLPAIQRDFVWGEDQIEKLLDSIMRGYPIGIVFLWETYSGILYRNFVKHWERGIIYRYHENAPNPRRLRLLLDGQQRLQSLYIGIYGTYEGKHLYLDVLSGREADDFAEDRFRFKFLLPVEAERMNAEGARRTGGESSYFVKVYDLISMSAWERHKMLSEISEALGLSSEDELRVGLNLSLLRDALFYERNILKATIIDENKPIDSKERKSEADVLEAFVRINRRGTPLAKSDLFFSMLKLGWRRSAETIPEFIKSLNEGNYFNFDIDFLLRSLFAVSGLGTRFDLNLLRQKSNVQAVKSNFKRCSEAIERAVEFVQKHCWVSGARLIGGCNNLLPLVHYFYYSAHDGEMSPREINGLRKALYLFGFSSLFSKSVERRFGVWLKELSCLDGSTREGFPLELALTLAERWEGRGGFGPALFNHNPALTLHVACRRNASFLEYVSGYPQLDTIFPRGELRRRGYDESEVSHFANFWILPKGRVPNRGGREPASYFADVSDKELKAAHISRSLLYYDRYREFLMDRAQSLSSQISRELKLTQSEIASCEPTAMS
jgi:hypothetical protein